MAPPKKFEKFRDVQEELGRSGAAIFRDANGVESLIIRFPYSVDYIHSYAEDSPFFLGLAQGKLLGSRCTNRLCGYRYATPRSHCMECGKPTEWFDPTCYTLQPLGQVGDVGRNSVPGPGILNLDIGLQKETRITEKLDTQFRAEFFNVINHPNFAEPNTIAFSGSFGQDPHNPQTYSPTAGQILGTSTTSRQIQFALKFIF